MARRWTIEEENKKRSELIDLYINQNKTIGEVGELLGIKESSVFDRLKRLNLKTIPEKKEHYLNKNWRKIDFPNFSSKLAEFFGIMLGDGHISRGQIWIFIHNGTEKEYVPYVKKLLESLFQIEAGVHYRKKEDMMNVFISSVDLIKFLKTKGLYATNKVKEQVKLPPWILKKDSYKKSFLRGFFDSDGSIYGLKFGVQMAFCNFSVPLLKTTREILLNLKYHPSKISSHKIYLTKKTDLYRYAKEVRFGNFKHIKKAIRFGLINEGV